MGCTSRSWSSGRGVVLAPSRESGCRLGIGAAGVRAANVGGEELEDALGGRRVGGEQGWEGNSPAPDSGAAD